MTADPALAGAVLEWPRGGDLTAALEALAPPGLPPFDPALIDLSDTLARAILRAPAARTHPELTALGFFMRRAAVEALKREAADLAIPRTRLVPRGIVFHVPPANVDTIFVYSWLLSMLCGNANVLRLSRRGGPVVDALVGVFARVFADAPPALARSLVLARWGHDAAITAAVSARADVRVIWGGDAAVQAIRAVPLPAHARELTFADRWSYAALGADAALSLDDEATAALAERFFNDTYWFDQLGCSSARLVVWVGAPDAAARAAERFWPALHRVIRGKGYAVDAGTAIAKQLFAMRTALDVPEAGRFAVYANELEILPVSALTHVKREHCGAGLFLQFVAPRVADLADYAVRRDQTLTVFGIEPGDVDALVARAGGRGIDRIVPVGEALSFGRFWDGTDLLAEFQRRIHIAAAP